MAWGKRAKTEHAGPSDREHTPEYPRQYMKDATRRLRRTGDKAACVNTDEDEWAGAGYDWPGY